MEWLHAPSVAVADLVGHRCETQRTKASEATLTVESKRVVSTGSLADEVTSLGNSERTAPPLVAPAALSKKTPDLDPLPPRPTRREEVTPVKEARSIGDPAENPRYRSRV
jgi:hypothetical protein